MRKSNKLQKRCGYYTLMLKQRLINLFKWEGLPFPQREIEKILIDVGYGAVVRHGEEIIMTSGAMSGVTNYPDSFTTWTFATPLISGIRSIGKGCVLVMNNSLYTGMRDFIEGYALQLAHADLSITTALINTRAQLVLSAESQQAADNLNQWYRSLENGNLISILNPTDLNGLFNSEGIKNLSPTVPSSSTLSHFTDVKNQIMRSFYADLGIRWLSDKKERYVVDEVSADSQALLFNIEDFLECRQQAAEEMNRMFGLSVSVALRVNPYASTQKGGTDDDEQIDDKRVTE